MKIDKKIALNGFMTNFFESSACTFDSLTQNQTDLFSEIASACRDAFCETKPGIAFFKATSKILAKKEHLQLQKEANLAFAAAIYLGISGIQLDNPVSFKQGRYIRS